MWSDQNREKLKQYLPSWIDALFFKFGYHRRFLITSQPHLFSNLEQ